MNKVSHKIEASLFKSFDVTVAENPNLNHRILDY